MKGPANSMISWSKFSVGLFNKGRVEKVNLCVQKYYAWVPKAQVISNFKDW